jgi:hypothetical protein
VGGDLKFTLGASQVWGLEAHVDCLSCYFIKKLEELGLLDVEPAKLTPTWRNRISREAHMQRGSIIS